MFINIKSNIPLFLSLLLGSFSDEAVQIIFALNISNSKEIYLTSMLLILGMAGGITSNLFFSKISKIIGVKRVLFFSLFIEAILIIVTSFFKLSIFYLLSSFILGGLGGMLWSAVLIMIPSISDNDEELNFINKYAHLIRNIGFMIGPVLGGGYLLFLVTKPHYFSLGG